jgi:hypothetical protein
MTSSNTSSAPVSSARLRSAFKKPAGGGTRPMLAGYGSQTIAASSPSGTVPHGATSVSAACADVTPGEAGMPCVARPDPASASRPSTCP